MMMMLMIMMMMMTIIIIIIIIIIPVAVEARRAVVAQVRHDPGAVVQAPAAHPPFDHNLTII